MKQKPETAYHIAPEGQKTFYLPARRRLHQKVQFHCRHCGTAYLEEYAVDYCWPDRGFGNDRGMVIICRCCGCRQCMETASRDSATGKGSTKGGTGSGVRPEKPGFNWVPALILALLMAVTVAAVVLIVGGGEKPDWFPSTGNASIRSSEEQMEEGQREDGLSSPEESKPVIQSTQPGEIGNLFINISEGGLMQIVGDRVYYTNPQDGYRIYSMDLAFRDNRLECDIPSFYLNYRDGALFFSGAEEGEKNLYRMELDSGELTLLSAQSTYEPKVVGDTIYYDDVTEKYSLYRCNLDGTGQTRISPGVVFYSCIVGDTIFYLDTQDDYHFYSMDLYGGNKQVLLDQSVRELSAQGDVLYLSLRDGGILEYHIGSGEFWQISDISVSSLVAADDGCLYFSNLDRDGYLFRMNNRGEELVKLSNEPVAFINVISNLISYENKDTGTFYWMLTDGSHYQEIH